MSFMSGLRMAFGIAHDNMKVKEAYQLVQRYFDVDLLPPIRQVAYHDVLNMSETHSVEAMAIRYLVEYGRYAAKFYDEMPAADRAMAARQFTSFAKKVGQLQDRGHTFHNHLLSEFATLVMLCQGDATAIRRSS